MQQSYWRYWGKARPDESGPSWHPLPCHSLDVAAVGREFLRQSGALRRHWSARLGLSEDVLLDLVTYFLALHDLGKFAVPFQALNSDLLATLQGGRKTQKVYGNPRHDSLGAILLADHYRLQPQVPVLSSLLDGGLYDAASFWISAVTGHHGQPPSLHGTVRAHFDCVDIESALGFADAAGKLLLPTSSVEAWIASCPDQRLDEHRRFSWWLAGLAVLADWLGSNTRYFAYCAVPDSLEQYWPQSQRQALEALAASGVVPRLPADAQAFATLFPEIGTGGTPLQLASEQVPLAAAPQLFVLEDVTGAGKTEAAVMLAHRLLSAGLGEGLYFALPTMATANQMYERIGRVYDRLFAPGSEPSLLLAHGARELSSAFRNSVLPEDRPPEPEDEVQETASQRCTAWLADTRKAALLAQVGVGTIDQALMAVLHAKHQSLRLLGLFGKVLIVDEVHACDSYLFSLLKSLLRFHREAGGSAILLSATLPESMRAELCAIYAPGHSPQSRAYPLLTRAAANGVAERAVATRPQVARKVDIQWLTDADACELHVLAAARAGQAVCWIRNTVGDAIKSYRRLQDQHSRVQLFHARFALGDRLRIEREAVNRFGRSGEDRSGQILVATQVVEQSLDLDFDAMVSDVAPIDLLIQRAGRLHRHARGERGTPTLAVFAPLPNTDADALWLGTSLRGSAYVYPDLGRLWLTVDELHRRGGWRMPDDARDLIEAVYGPDAFERVPAALQAVMDSQTGQRQAAVSVAWNNALTLAAGYSLAGSGLGNWASEAHTPTRLGDPTVTLHLLKWADGVLGDFCPDPDPRRASGLSRLSVRAAMVSDAAEPSDPRLAAALEAWRTRMGRAGKWVVPVALVESDGGWAGRGRQSKDGDAGRDVAISYSANEGLSISRVGA